ncbi:hypothetical protein NST58_13030 [Paenibacillus sp. FSL R10-2796]|uniref:hypothetical protein n=1 Tax=Paenibacillus sp. FSL R10-2796 TaxID=2954663 RepID=UPI0030D825CC
MKDETLRSLEGYIGNLVGRTFIKSVAIENGVVNIFYFSDYEDYKSNNENPLITEIDYDDYFTQNKIDKILVGEPARILRQFPYLNNVYIMVPHKTYTFDVSVSRERLNSFLGYKIESLSVYDESWREKFADMFIYNKGNRNRFLLEFSRKYSTENNS